MIETSRIYSPFPDVSRATRGVGVAGLLLSAACATPEVATKVEPVSVAEPAQVAVASPPAAAVPAPPTPDEARALLAQAETDIQRARTRRALWSKAWESLLAARASAAANDDSGVIRHASRASELAQLGLEQLAFPAVR
jgi:hypothetical protein